MQETEENLTLRYDNIIVSQRGITEADGRKVVLFVAAAEIEKLVLKFGRADHRPIVSFLIGTLLTLVGFYGLANLILAPKGFRSVGRSYSTL